MIGRLVRTTGRMRRWPRDVRAAIPRGRADRDNRAAQRRARIHPSALATRAKAARRRRSEAWRRRHRAVAVAWRFRVRCGRGIPRGARCLAPASPRSSRGRAAAVGRPSGGPAVPRRSEQASRRAARWPPSVCSDPACRRARRSNGFSRTARPGPCSRGLAARTGEVRNRRPPPSARAGPRRDGFGGDTARSADAMGERIQDGSAVVLVAAHPRPAGGARDGRHPRARAPARVRPWARILGARRVAPTRSPGVASMAQGARSGAPPRARVRMRR